MSDRGIPLPPSLDARGTETLAEALEAAASDATVRVVVLRGGPGVFCRGLDIDALLAAPDRESRRAAIGAYQRSILALRRGGKPSVALVDGVAQGGGVGLAAACDVVIATARATFALPEALFGLAPAMVFPLLLERMPPQKARLWALTPHTRTAAEALALGLCDELVEADRAERAVARWVRQFSRIRARSAAAIAELSVGCAGRPLAEALAVGGDFTLSATDDPSVGEAVRRFREDGQLGEEDG